MNIFLIGPRGSGKSTAGRVAAEKMGMEFADADLIFSENFGEIAAFVEREGWGEFRRRESEILAKTSKMAGQMVLATGGGIVLAEANRALMRALGIVFYLRAPASTLAARLAADPEPGQRPSLTGQGLLEEIREVLARREELYCQTAHHIIDAAKNPEQVASDIMIWPKNQTGPFQPDRCWSCCSKS